MLWNSVCLKRQEREKCLTDIRSRLAWDSLFDLLPGLRGVVHVLLCFQQPSKIMAVGGFAILGLNVYINVHGINLTGTTSRVYSCHTSSARNVLDLDLDKPLNTMFRIKGLLKMQEWMRQWNYQVVLSAQCTFGFSQVLGSLSNCLSQRIFLVTPCKSTFREIITLPRNRTPSVRVCFRHLSG